MIPARDTYHVDMTVTGEYDDAPTWRSTHADYLSPGQDRSVAMANVLRSAAAALELAPEQGDTRSDLAIYATLDSQRRQLMLNDGFPASRAMKLAMLWSIADDLGLDWYGVR